MNVKQHEAVTTSARRQQRRSAPPTHRDLDVDVTRRRSTAAGDGVLQDERQHAAVRRHLVAAEARRKCEVEVRLRVLYVAELIEADRVGGGVGREAVGDGRVEATRRHAEVVRACTVSAEQRADLDKMTSSG